VRRPLGARVGPGAARDLLGGWPGSGNCPDCFPQAVLILDYYHASQHVVALARRSTRRRHGANWALRWQSLIYDSELTLLQAEARAAADPVPTEAVQRELDYLDATVRAWTIATTASRAGSSFRRGGSGLQAGDRTTTQAVRYVFGARQARRPWPAALRLAFGRWLG